MKTSRVTCSILILVAVVAAAATLRMLKVRHERAVFYRDLFKPSKLRVVDEKENDRRRDALLAISNPIKQRDAFLSYWWEQYKNTSRLERPTTVKGIQDAVTKVAYLDSRIDLISWILFGPQMARSILRSVIDKKHPPPCLKSTLQLFEQHCGTLIEHSMMRSLANLCNYVADKEAINEAILLACGRRRTESHGIDVANPKADITPAPIPGTFQYCGRAIVNDISRTKPDSYAKTYNVMVVPSNSIPEEWHSMIHICFHRNDSRGSCHCEQDEWRSIENGSWSSVMPSSEQRYVDVKFINGISGFVTVSLNEVSPAVPAAVPPARRRHYGLLVVGIALLLMAVSKHIIDEYVDAGIVHFVKGAMCVLAVTCIFLSSIGIRSAEVVVCSCLALCYMITSIITPLLSKIKTLGDGGSKESQELLAEFVASPEFDYWMMKNAHRIKLRRHKHVWQCLWYFLSRRDTTVAWGSAS